MSLFIAVAACGANALKAQSVDAGRRPPVLRGTDPATAQPRDRTNSTENRSANAGTATVVMIPTVVMDRNGRYVANLRKEDFRVYDDGVEQQVAYFAPIEKPFTVALMLDVSGSTKYQMDQICQAADTFISHLRNNDR
jgi:Ca-activated chloride channel family protein